MRALPCSYVRWPLFRGSCSNSSAAGTAQHLGVGITNLQFAPQRRSGGTLGGGGSGGGTGRGGSELRLFAVPHYRLARKSTEELLAEPSSTNDDVSRHGRVGSGRRFPFKARPSYPLTRHHTGGPDGLHPAPPLIPFPAALPPAG